jgi:hypothetical protein
MFSLLLEPLPITTLIAFYASEFDGIEMVKLRMG